MTASSKPSLKEKVFIASITHSEVSSLLLASNPVKYIKNGIATTTAIPFFIVGNTAKAS